MREVDEEVRKEQAVEFWQRWGKWLAGLVIVGLAAFGGWLYWSNQQITAAEGEAEELSQLLGRLNEGDLEGAEDQLGILATSSRPAVRAAAMLTAADLALQEGDEAAAVAGFAGIAADSALPQQYRDLALIRQTAVEFGSMESQDVIDRLAALAVPGNPWFGSAGELTAVALMAQGNNDAAGALFAQIAEDEDVPQTLRDRAVQMAGVLGVDAVPDEPVDMRAEQTAPGIGAAEEQIQ
jgi:hypothetical protein